MDSQINTRLQHQNQHKGSSYQLKEINQTPKKQHILVKFEEKDDQPTLQKNILNLIEKTKINGIQTVRQFKKIKRPWTREEDDQLRKLVQTKGAKQWAHISSFFEDRCGKQCRERWHNHLRNGIRKGEWTSQEEWTLFLGVQAYGKKWSIISKLLEGRTENTLKNHWNCKMKPKKPYLEKRLEFLLRQNNFQCLTETKLFQIIKEKKGLKQNSVETIIKVLQDSLRQFFIVKEEILGKQDSIKQQSVNQHPEKGRFYDMYQFGSFVKSKNLEVTTFQMKKNQRRDTPQQITKHDTWNEEEYTLRQFELDPSDQDAEECDMDIESSRKSSILRHDIFYGKSESDSESSYQSYSEQGQGEDEGDYCDRYGDGGFCSPIKPNIFQTIDLGESNHKKKLFEE